MQARVSTSASTRRERTLRIVSLVPSLTETLAAWGLIDSLAGRTRYCVEPTGTIDRVEVVGGTKNPDIPRIRELRPDLVVVNCEENRREDYDALTAAGLRVHVTHPRSVEEAAEMLEELGRVVGVPLRGADLARRCLAARDAAIAAACGAPRVPVFCPIWRNPWMTFCDATYIGDVLTVAGMRNVFGEARGTDFFEVELDEVRRRRPEVVLLPDEPYVFTGKHARELEQLGIGARRVLVDGKNLSWYGPRTPLAIEQISRLARSA